MKGWVDRLLLVGFLAAGYILGQHSVVNAQAPVATRERSLPYHFVAWSDNATVWRFNEQDGDACAVMVNGNLDMKMMTDNGLMCDATPEQIKRMTQNK